MHFLKNMKILAIETSSVNCSIALLNDDKILAVDKNLPLQQSTHLLPMIKALLQDANISLNQLDAVAFGCGPGSFTGVRIAASVTQGLSYALNLPVIPVSSLAAIAQSAFLDLGWDTCMVAIDARIQEVYWGMYAVNAEGLVHLISRELVSKPEEIFYPEPVFAVGNAWEVYAGRIAFKPKLIDSSRLPSASSILPLAKAKFMRQEWVTSEEAVPQYLRDNVAKVSKS
jgi:tRNA threonylcarbamoyladenosine biosynthesis protein TsaB